MVRFVLVPSFFREKWLEEISDEALLSALEEQEDMQPGANQRKHKFSDCSMESEHLVDEGEKKALFLPWMSKVLSNTM